MLRLDASTPPQAHTADYSEDHWGGVNGGDRAETGKVKTPVQGCGVCMACGSCGIGSIHIWGWGVMTCEIVHSSSSLFFSTFNSSCQTAITRYIVRIATNTGKFHIDTCSWSPLSVVPSCTALHVVHEAPSYAPQTRPGASRIRAPTGRETLWQAWDMCCELSTQTMWRCAADPGAKSQTPLTVDPNAYQASSCMSNSEESHNYFSGVVLDNGTNIGSAAHKAAIDNGQAFIMERRPSGGTPLDMDRLTMMERKPSNPAKAAMIGSTTTSRRNSSRRGSGSAPSGQAVVYHTRTQVCSREAVQANE